MRGTVVGSIQLFNLIGQIMAAGINRAYSTSTEKKGYGTADSTILALCMRLLS